MQSRWIKWHSVNWINSTARDELLPEERGTFVDFVSLASFPGFWGSFKISSWEALARKLNTPLNVIESTRDKCLETNRIVIDDDVEGIWVTIINFYEYQSSRSDGHGVNRLLDNIDKSVNTLDNKNTNSVDNSYLQNRIDKNRLYKNREEEEDKNEEINANKLHSLNTFKDWHDILNISKNKVGFLVTAFKHLHQDAPSEEFENLGGRIAMIVKKANNDHGFVLKAIWDTSSVEIAGFHLDYIQQKVQKSKKEDNKKKVRDYTGGKYGNMVQK